MMARLPNPGGDAGDWGNILNDFLSHAHTGDGSLKDGIVTRSHLSNSVQASLDNADAAVSASVPDATSVTKGKIQLTGDLGGTADNPAIAAGAITSAKIADGTITDIDISASAAIAQTKIQDLATDLAAKAASADALLKTDNLSGLTSQLTARTNLGLGTAATADLPAAGNASAAQAVKGDDTRLSDVRIPTDASVTPAKMAGSPTITSGNGIVWNGSAWVGTDLATQVELDAHINDTLAHPRELGYLIKQDGGFTSTAVFANPSTGTDVPGTTLTITKGARPILIHVKVGRLDNLDAGGTSVVVLLEDNVDVDRAVVDIGIAGKGTGVVLEHRSTVAPGEHTYKLRLTTSSGHTAVIAADILLPLRMSVTEVAAE